jgi:hypothetical protein
MRIAVLLVTHVTLSCDGSTLSNTGARGKFLHRRVCSPPVKTQMRASPMMLPGICQTHVKSSDSLRTRRGLWAV